jgi:hypothetical protein
VQLQGRQLVASVALIKAVGGGWHAGDPVPASATMPLARADNARNSGQSAPAN